VETNPGPDSDDEEDLDDLGLSLQECSLSSNL